MNFETGIILVGFWIIVFISLCNRSLRHALFLRTKSEWLLDLVGLAIHGTVVPIFQTFVVAGLLSYFLPSGKGVFYIPGLLAFLLNFVGVDYLYYWNHRLLHSQTLWRFHALHHSGKSFDVFTTSRNSAVTTFLILYVWVNGIFLYLLADPKFFLLGIVGSNILDLLRHSRFSRWPDFILARIFISPRDHAWHHSADVHEINFGGNFSLWDRLHGTYYAKDKLPVNLGNKDGPKHLWKAFWRGVS